MFEEKRRCQECHWTISFAQSACLNRKCSLRDQKEIERIDFFLKQGHWPKK